MMAPVITYCCSNANRWLFHGAEGWLCVAFEEKKDEVAGRKRGRRNKRAIMNDQPGGVLSDQIKRKVLRRRANVQLNTID